MIAGTSTGGVIAIMLGRLRMTVDECIAAYTSLSNKVFEKKSHRVNINGRLQGRFDTAALKQAVKQILVDSSHSEDALLKDCSDGACKVLMYATSKETGDTVCLTSYCPARALAHLYISTIIWQACRATSAATTFFDPIAIGPYREQFVDGALGANNPVYTLWTQAQDVWGDDQLRSHLRCLVSIGTGVPALHVCYWRLPSCFLSRRATALLLCVLSYIVIAFGDENKKYNLNRMCTSRDRISEQEEA